MAREETRTIRARDIVERSHPWRGHPRVSVLIIACEGRISRFPLRDSNIEQRRGVLLANFANSSGALAEASYMGRVQKFNSVLGIETLRFELDPAGSPSI
jgi:hypothetical protein